MVIRHIILLMNIEKKRLVINSLNLFLVKKLYFLCNFFNLDNSLNINSKLNKLTQDFQNTSDNLEKIKLEKNALIKEQGKYYNFVDRLGPEISGSHRYYKSSLFFH